MSDRPALIELVREPPFAWLVLSHPGKLDAWSWESSRQITAHAERLRFESASASPLFTSDDMARGHRAMAPKENVKFEGK